MALMLSILVEVVDDVGNRRMCNALSKELYSLKQELGENVAEVWVPILQQIQIFQLEYPGRIQPEHIEEMKHDDFYEGFNPEYWQILAHKVDGEHQASCSNLLLVTWKLERQAEARDSLPPRTATTMDQRWCVLRWQGICFPHVSWRWSQFCCLSYNHRKWQSWKRFSCESRKWI